MRSGVPFKLVRPLCFPRSRQRITCDAMRRGGKNCGTWWCAGPNCLIDFSSLLTIYDDSRNRTKLRMVLNETTDAAAPLSVQGSARRIVSFWIPRRRNACSFVCFSNVSTFSNLDGTVGDNVTSRIKRICCKCKSELHIRIALHPTNARFMERWVCWARA